jgi:hypothetical protein
MAIQKSIEFTTQYGKITVPNCYICINSVEINKTEATAAIIFYRDNKINALQEQSHPFAYDLEGSNPIKQAYEHLKTLPEFTDAVDC